MFRVSSSVEYAVRIMLRLGAQPGGGTVNAERISSAEGIPRDFVDQLLMRLRRDGLVESQRGVRGGYRLTRSPAKTTLGGIIRAVEGRAFLSTCDRYAEKGDPCGRSRSCSVRPVWKRLGALVDGYLDKVSLAELSPEKRAPLKAPAGARRNPSRAGARGPRSAAAHLSRRGRRTRAEKG